jgi:hypothetical protein
MTLTAGARLGPYEILSTPRQECRRAVNGGGLRLERVLFLNVVGSRAFSSHTASLLNQSASSGA